MFDVDSHKSVYKIISNKESFTFKINIESLLGKVLHNILSVSKPYE